MVEENTSTVDSTPLSVEDIRKNYLTKRLFKWWLTRPLAIYDVFKHMYGEENVDMNVLKPIGKYNTFVDTWYNVAPSSIIKVDEPSDPTILHNYKHPVWAIPTLQEYEDLLSYIFSCENQELVTRGNYMSTDYCCYITVHFPKLTITNENGNSIDITHLWVRIEMNALGILDGDIYMNRSEYTKAQYKSEYKHSHLPRLCREDPNVFDKFCFGKGPITYTINKLKNEYDLTAWQLFCVELQTCLQIESLVGGPYIRISEITEQKTKVSVASFVQDMHYADLPGTVSKNNSIVSLINYKDFIKYLIKNKVLKLSCRTCAFTVGESYFHYITNISKAFIDWYNQRYQEHKEALPLEELVNRNILCPHLFKNGVLYKIKEERSYIPMPTSNTIEILKFKGKPIYLNIIEESLPENYNVSYLLSYEVAIRILITILQILNYRYDPTATSFVTLGEPGVKVKYLCPV